jgi:hypothetical protein
MSYYRRSLVCGSASMPTADQGIIRAAVQDKLRAGTQSDQDDITQGITCRLWRR